MTDKHLSVGKAADQFHVRAAGEILRDFQSNEESLVVYGSKNLNKSTAGERDYAEAGGFFEHDANLGKHGVKVPVSKTCIYMNSLERGVFIIFNQINFDEGLNLQDREEAQDDYELIEEMAKQLGFEYVRTYHNYTKDEIKQVITRITSRNASYENYDCFACAILTHGKDGEKIFAKDAEMSLSDFTAPFQANKCKTLAEKPKLFFVQACRGNKNDNGAVIKKLRPVCCDATSENEDESPDKASSPVSDQEEEMMTFKIPAQADFLIAHASPPNHTSFRNEKTGSWFVQALHKCFTSDNACDMELMQIMTRVNKMVAERQTHDESAMQIPSITSQLRAEVFFRPKSKPQSHNTSTPPKGKGMSTSTTKAFVELPGNSGCGIGGW